MEALVSFLLTLERLKGVERKIKPLGLDRFENSAEHSWQLAVFALALRPWVDPAVDLDRVVRMLLVHDLGEIDTGDTFAFVEGGWDERRRDERAAVTRICALLPEGHGNGLRELWLEFDAAETAEAKVAHAIDRAMPVVLNLANGGQSWRDNGVSYERVVRRVEPPIREGCPALWEHLAAELAKARERGLFGA